MNNSCLNNSWNKVFLPILSLFFFTQNIQANPEAEQPKEYITIAILAKDKAQTLPLYLTCIEQQTWPKSQTYLYVKTNNNNDATEQILREWLEKVGEAYAGIYFDATDVPQRVQRFGQHEWNNERLRVLCRIRQDSVNWAVERKSHYFIADCDNFIKPHTIKALLDTNLPIVSPLLRTGNNLYSNYHAAIDADGYYAHSPFYIPLLNREIKGLVELPVVHCTYFVRSSVLARMSYHDHTERYDYVIFSDTARKKGIPQYLDTRELYGYLSFAETKEQFAQEPWLPEFLKNFTCS